MLSKTVMSEIVNNQVATFRQKTKLTQEELASLVDVSRQTIIAIEKGNYSPSVALALKLSRIFKVRVEDIFSIEK